MKIRQRLGNSLIPPYEDFPQAVRDELVACGIGDLVRGVVTKARREGVDIDWTSLRVTGSKDLMTAGLRFVVDVEGDQEVDDSKEAQ